MSIDNHQQQQSTSQSHEWHHSLESVLSERKSIDAFRLWLRIQRKDDALDLYLAIIAFRRHARSISRNNQHASSIAFGICRRYIRYLNDYWIVFLLFLEPYKFKTHCKKLCTFYCFSSKK